MIFILGFVVINQINFFLDVEPTLHTRYKYHLIMLYNLFTVLLNSVCLYFVENVGINVLQGHRLVIFFFFVVSLPGFWYQGNAGLIE